MRYDESIKVYRDSMDVMAYEREEGLEKGLEKGREEEKRLMVRNLKSLSFSIENIMQVTGLSAKEIEEI